MMTVAEAVMEQADHEALADLTDRWQGAYHVYRPAPGIWIARRADGMGMLRANGSEVLRAMILADYAADRPSP